MLEWFTRDDLSTICKVDYSSIHSMIKILRNYAPIKKKPVTENHGAMYAIIYSIPKYSPRTKSNIK